MQSSSRKDTVPSTPSQIKGARAFRRPTATHKGDVMLTWADYHFSILWAELRPSTLDSGVGSRESGRHKWLIEIGGIDASRRNKIHESATRADPHARCCTRPSTRTVLHAPIRTHARCCTRRDAFKSPRNTPSRFPRVREGYIRLLKRMRDKVTCVGCEVTWQSTRDVCGTWARMPTDAVYLLIHPLRHWYVAQRFERPLIPSAIISIKAGGRRRRSELVLASVRFRLQHLILKSVCWTSETIH